ncbi:hypothetical protein MtrunA17_Chr1g0178271 [Medicago truncatula]|uniref:Transmembrane protein n=1 Tax=Medicago truncatula TaxID=3880 RepID=A0A396JT70_MEDTR|nr:hypothetical protein MtrunA17_Chr1g0178271 [Medicago truncatula]
MIVGNVGLHSRTFKFITKKFRKILTVLFFLLSKILFAVFLQQWRPVGIFHLSNFGRHRRRRLLLRNKLSFLSFLLLSRK